MQGRLATVINVIFFGLGAIIVFLSMNYFITTIGTTAVAGWYDGVGDDRFFNFSDIVCATKKELKKNPKKYENKFVKEPEFCTYLNVEIAAGAFALMAGLVQMVVCALDVATKWVNWVLWVIGHLVSLFLDLVAFVMIFAVCIIYPLHMTRVCIKKHSTKAGKISDEWTNYCEQFYPNHASFATHSNQTLKAGIFLFGTILLVNFLFCVIGIFVMIRKRKDMAEGGPGILHDRGEQVVQTINKTFERSSQTERPPRKSSTTTISTIASTTSRKPQSLME
jgi:hypothetical protein